VRGRGAGGNQETGGRFAPGERKDITTTYDRGATNSSVTDKKKPLLVPEEIGFKREGKTENKKRVNSVNAFPGRSKRAFYGPSAGEDGKTTKPAEQANPGRLINRQRTRYPGTDRLVISGGG